MLLIKKIDDFLEKLEKYLVIFLFSLLVFHAAISVSVLISRLDAVINA